MPWPSFQMRRFWRAPPKQHTPFEVAVLAALLNLEMKVNKIMAQDDDLEAAVSKLSGKVDAVVAEVKDLAGQLAAVGSADPRVQAVIDRMNSMSDELDNANQPVAAQVPAAPPATE